MSYVYVELCVMCLYLGTILVYRAFVMLIVVLNDIFLFCLLIY